MRLIPRRGLRKPKLPKRRQPLRLERLEDRTVPAVRIHVNALDFAVSRSSNPTTLSAADWAFYKINTTESRYDTDYPGNIGYNADAVVFTLNMFGSASHVQVVSLKAADLASAAAS